MHGGREHRRAAAASWPHCVHPGGPTEEWEERYGSEAGKDNDECGRRRAERVDRIRRGLGASVPI